MNPKAEHELDTDTYKELDRIIHKEENDLNETDKAFLRARKMYLKDKHIARYPNVFKKGAKDPKIVPSEDPKREDWSDHPADKKFEEAELEDDEEDEDEDGLVEDTEDGDEEDEAAG